MVKRIVSKRLGLTMLLFFWVCYIHSQKTIDDLKTALDMTAVSNLKADLCYELSRKYSDLAKYDSALYYAGFIKEFSQKDNNVKGMGKYHLAQSVAYSFKNMPALAKEHAFAAIHLFQSVKDYAFSGSSHHQLAKIYQATKKPDSALHHNRIAIDFSTKAKDAYMLCLEHSNVGMYYYGKSEFDSAANHLLKSVQFAEQINDKLKIHASSGALGMVFLRLQDLPNAFKFLEFSLNNQVQPNGGTIQLIYEYAVCLSLMHLYPKADSLVNELEKLYQRAPTSRGALLLSKVKGILEHEKQNYTQAKDHFQRAYNKTRETFVFQYDLMEITLWLGKTEIRTRNCDSAIIHLRHAYQISSKENFTLGQIEASLLISKCFEMVKIPDSALYYYRAHASIKDSILSLQKQRTIMNVTAQYENEKKEQEIRILQKEKDANALLLQLQDQQIEKQQLQDDKKSQQLALISQQNEINKLDASQKTLHLENEKKDNEKNQAKLTLLEQEAAYQKLLASKENQQKKVIYISIAAILSLLGYFIFRYIRKKRLINQQEVLNERLRISRELHDEVGATLSGIAMYSHLTKEQIKDGKTKEVEKSLNNIQQSAAEMILKLSDIVWLVNPEKDSMQKLIERLEQYAGEMTTIKGMEVNIHVSPRLANISLPVETRRNIYLFCKEAINNAVKYSNASIIELSMKESDNKKIEIAINDNGNGFDTSKLKNGNGLANMKQRAVDIAGDYLLQSSPGSGTKIGLTLKIT